jgi:hypothetical protein
MAIDFAGVGASGNKLGQSFIDGWLFLHPFRGWLVFFYNRLQRRPNL